MRLNVRLEDIDDELMFKRVHIRYGDKNFTTPVKASFKNARRTGINEIYRSFTLETLDKCIKDESFERTKNQKLNSDRTPDINIVVSDYASLEDIDDRHLEALSDMQYSYSDLIVTPTWSKLLKKPKEVDEEVVDRFLNFTNRFIDNIETLNNKSILGLIPSKIPRIYLDRIISNYYCRGITSFAIDFDGRSVASNKSWLRKFYKTISGPDYNLLEQSFVYSLNSNEGKFVKRATEIIAADFIGTGFGVDVIGSMNHINPRFRPIPKTGMQIAPPENSLRLFNKESYGYLRKTLTELSESGINNRTELKVQNIQEQYSEMLNIQSMLSEENTIVPYMSTKPLLGETIDDIKKLRQDTRPRN